MGCGSKESDAAASEPPPGKATTVPIPSNLPPETQARIRAAQAQDDARQKEAMAQGAAMMAAQQKANK